MHSERRPLVIAAFLAAVGIFLCPDTARAAQTWQALVGAQTKDMGKQAIAFLPNEMWIHVGDSINWTSGSGDIHTISFVLNLPLPFDFTAGCPITGTSSSGVVFDGVHCISAPPLVQGQSFTVKFTAAGTFKLICLVHSHMSGVIHVLPASSKLPYDQAFYDKEAADQIKALFTDTDSAGGMSQMLSARVIPGKSSVAAGLGEMNGTGAGFQSLSIVRFFGDKVEINAGDTVEWTVRDPAMPHTITFGTPPDNPGPPSNNVSADSDGALHATIHFPSENVHSGILIAAPQDQPGVPVSPPGTTVFRATFPNPGTYHYQCELHDNLGMEGTVVVK